MKKIALIHDWLTGMRGGEKVLEVFCELFPTADLYTLVHVPGSVSPVIENRRIFTSRLQQMPQVDKKYRYYLPLMPTAIEQFDLSGYDGVLSSSHCVAKGVKVKDPAQHISYCNTPMRYIWDQYEEYFGPEVAKPWVRLAMKLVRPYLQSWDVKSSARVGQFIGNSKNIQERIQRIFHREAAVIYPPADVEFYHLNLAARENPEDFYLVISALVPYKKVDLAVEAMTKLGKKLVVIGSGPESARLRRMAGGRVQFLGWGSDEMLRQYYQKARALIFPGTEDFGIVPVEAMACGTPVIALGRGGATETVVENETGVFFREPTVESLCNAIEAFEKETWNPAAIRRQAERFSRPRFKSEIAAFCARFLS